MIRALLILLPVLPASFRLAIYLTAEQEMSVHHPDRIEVCLALADRGRK